MLLTREMILSVDDKAPTLTKVDIPEWGGEAYIRVMTGLERERFEAALTADNKVVGTSLRALLASLVLCDEKGKPLFAAADLVALGEKSSNALQRIYVAGLKLNAIGKSGVDELEKNSEAATSGATPSDSRPGTGSPTSTAS